MAQKSKNEDRKQRIREAFHDGKQVERMPAREDMAPQHSDDVIYRVAPYCRVSTMSEMQAESFEIQQQYYNEFVAKHPNWTLVRIYADEGISANSVNNRKPLYFSSHYRISVAAAFEKNIAFFCPVCYNRYIPEIKGACSCQDRHGAVEFVAHRKSIPSAPTGARMPSRSC